MKMYKEAAGIISKEPVWVCIANSYLYTGDTFFQLLRVVFTKWNNDQYLVG